MSNNFLELPLFSLTVGQFRELLSEFQTNNGGEVSEIMDKEECCRLTGYSVDAINKMISNNEIPYYKPKGRKKIYFRRCEIINWLFSNPIETKEQFLNRKDQELINRKGGCYN